MRRYIKNLLMALHGHDPFAWELSEVRSRLDIKATDYEYLREQYQKALSLWNDATTECEVAKGQLDNALKLVENLRERLAEREETIKQINTEYQKRIAEMDTAMRQTKTEQ